MHYEYQVLSGNSLVNEKQLNDLALEGWELITIVEWNKLFYFYFKRLVD